MTPQRQNPRSSPLHAAQAHSIAQRWLDIAGAALISGDFDSFATQYDLPHALFTPHAARLVHTQDAMRRAFSNMVAFYRDLGITKLDRRVDDVRVDGEDVVRHTFHSRLLRGDTVVRGPYPSHAVVMHKNGAWRVVESTHTLAPDGLEQGAALLDDLSRPAPHHLLDRHEIQGLCADVLDRVGNAYLTGDFDLFRNAIHLPCLKQGANGSQVFETAQDLRQDFDAYMAQLRRYNVTDLVYTLQNGHFVDASRIHGTFRIHVLSGAQMVLPSYVSAITFQRNGNGRWQLSSILHPVDRLTFDMLVNAATGPTHP